MVLLSWIAFIYTVDFPEGPTLEGTELLAWTRLPNLLANNIVLLRKTREGWHLLTFAAEAIGTHGVWKWAFHLLVRCGAHRADKRDCCPVQYFVPHQTLFHFICPHRPAKWADSRAAPPTSYYLSQVLLLVTWVWSEYLSIMMVVKYLVQASWGTRSSRSPILI